MTQQRENSSKRLPAVILLGAVAVAIAVADQLIKLWAENTLPRGETVPVIGEAVQWLYVLNPGAAFSFLSGHTWVFTLFAVVVAVVLIVQLWRVRSRLWALSYGMLLGGTLGNLYDRLLREPGFAIGHVVDYIYTPWLLSAVYNLADMAIVGSVILIVLLVLFGLRPDGTRYKRERAADPEAKAEDADAAEEAEDAAADPAADPAAAEAAGSTRPKTAERSARG